MNQENRSTRREFLQGRSAVRAVSNLRWLADADDPSAPHFHETDVRQGHRGYLVQVGRKAMACEFQVYLNAGQHDGDLDAALMALDLIERLEDQLTVYRDHSEVSRINQQACDRPCSVEPRLFHLLDECQALHQETGGAFDITAGPLVRLWGFLVRKGQFPSSDEVQQTLRQIGSQHFALDDRQLTVRFQKHGMEINLGSIGKGYALDRAAEVLSEAGVDDFMIHGGQSSILARGSRLSGCESAGWRVALSHPLRPEQRLAEIVLDDRALGTSGSGNQFFYHRGRRYGHVLDPRSGRPAEGVLSSTVLSKSAAEADALATAFFVMGVDAARDYCRDHAHLSAVFVCPAKRQGSVALETIGLEGQLRILDQRLGAGQALDEPEAQL